MTSSAKRLARINMPARFKHSNQGLGSEMAVGWGDNLNKMFKGARLNRRRAEMEDVVDMHKAGVVKMPPNILANVLASIKRIASGKW